MLCNVRTNSVNSLIKKGAIDSSMTIIDGDLFNELNQTYSDIAKTKYGVKNDGLLFSKEVKEVPRLGASVYNREDTKSVLKAVGNDEMFEELQNNYNSQTGQSFQLDSVPASKSSPELIAKIMAVGKQMGIDFQDLATYAKKTGLDTKDIAGVADLFRGVVAVAQGREDQALTEETVHIATAILEQTNPQLITSLISQIGKYKIYNVVLDAYKNQKEYQLSNGKPDIRKIKKEAVDKLIVEMMINQSEGSTDFPELMEKKDRNAVQRMWDAVLEAIRSLYRKSKIDLFGETAARIAAGDVKGTVADIKEGGLFFQTEQIEALNKYYDQIIDKDGRLKIVLETKDADGKVIKKRHRMFDGTIEVEQSVTEKAKGQKKYDEVAPEQQMEWDQMKDWGTVGHDFIRDVFNNELIDANGYKKTETPTNIKTTLNPDLQKKIRDFARELINSFKPGTRFIVERQVINDKVKGMIASTVDFKALEPNTDPKTMDKIPFYIDTLDWKFTKLNKETNEDIPFPKQKEWKIQMGEYGKIDIVYGAKYEQLRKQRMIQFIAGYTPKIKNDKTSPLVLTTLEIGKLDNVKETNLYLLPVALDTETTGNKEVDSLVKSLRTYYEKLYIAPVAEGKKWVKKKTDLNQISKAIRHLHMQLNFEPLYNTSKTFLNNAVESFKSFENVDYNKLTKEEIEDKLQDLLELQRSAEKFTRLDEVFLTTFPPGTQLNEKDSATLKNLRQVARSTQEMENKIIKLSQNYVKWLVVKTGVLEEAFAKEAIDAEVEVDTMSKTFLEGSKLAPTLTRTAAKLIQDSSNLAAIKTGRMINAFAKLLAPLQKQADAFGKSAFDMIGKVSGGNLELFKKIDSQFFKDLKKAKEDKNKQFLLDNMNVAEYNKLSKQQIDDEIEVINKTTYSTNSDDNFDIQQRRIKNVRNEFDINRETFNGYNSYQFKKLYEKVIKEEDHYSEEYKEMQKNKPALDMWEFLTALNQEAINMGYLNKQGLSFFPLIEASLFQKFSRTSDKLAEGRDFFSDLINVRVNESQQYSKTDPETGERKRITPTYFTTNRNIDEDTDKAVHKLSTDLNKVGTMWIQALMKYQQIKGVENTLLILDKVEQAKEALLLDDNQSVVVEGGVNLTFKSKRNADALRVIIDDYLYGLGEDLNSLGNRTLSNVTGKFKEGEKSENTQLSIKKGLRNSNKLIQAGAVGLKPLIAIANTFGNQFQAFINAGNKIKRGDATKNLVKIVSGVGVTTIDKGLLDLIVPLNEDIALQKRRDIAKGQSYIKWLGTWSFSDAMMSTNSIPEKRMQLGIGLAMNDTSMVNNGKIVNIRQYVKAEDRKKKYAKGVTEAERRDIERTYEDRVKALQESSSLPKIAKIENDEVVIPGVSDEALAEYRTSIIDYIKKLNGQMSQDNKAGYSRDTIFKSFMMFRTWIPKLVSERTMSINKSVEQDDWEYGRVRAFLKTWAHLGFKNIFKMREIINGTDKGLAILDEMLEAKKAEYLRKNGKELHITREEFYDLMRKELSNEMKELGLLLSMIGIFFAAKAAAPPEDADALTKNRYKYLAKGINKIVDEVSFYYNPLSFEAISKGNIIPALSLLVKAEKVFTQLSKEAYGQYTGDQKMIDDAHPAKYIFDMLPPFSQIQTEILPYVDAEFSKEWGNRVSSQSRVSR